MKKTLFLLSLVLLSCNETKKENTSTSENQKIQLFEQLQKNALNTALTAYDLSFNSELDDTQVLDSTTLKRLTAEFDYTQKGKKTSFKEAIGSKMYVMDYTDYEDFIFLSLVTPDELGNSLYFLTLSKQNRDANIVFVGDSAYDELQFMSYISGKKVNNNSFDFNAVNTNYEFPEGVENSKEYYTEKDSISFKITILDKGMFDKKIIDSVRTKAVIKTANK